MDLQIIETVLLVAIQAFDGQLPIEQLKCMAELVKAGESGIALENLCTQLSEFDIPVDRDLLNKLRDIGIAMGIDSKYWEELRIS